MIKKIRELFSFTQKEKYGIVTLLVVIVLLIIINYSLPYIVKNEVIDTTKWETTIIQQQQQQSKNEIVNANEKAVEAETIASKIESFDPNNVTAEYLIKIGIPAKVASNWQKYLEKGGHFYNKEKVEKIYGMAPQLFEKISKFLIFNKAELKTEAIKPKEELQQKEIVSNKISTGNETKNTNKKIEIVEINSADTTALLSVPGFGPVLSARIIKYRNWLGGFCNISQLNEIYGMKEEHLKIALPHIRVNSELIKRLNINFATVSELGRHPYIGYKKAKLIVKKRDEKGKFASISQLEQIIENDTLARLTPYLIINQ